MSQLDKTFPTNDCSMCILSPKLVEMARHPLISLMTLTEVTGVSGEAPDFKVKVRHNPRYVDVDKCVGCGICSEKCPVKVPNEYDAGVMQRKAIYIPFAQAVPLKFSIDSTKCLKLTKGPRAGCASKACPAGAVNYEDRRSRRPSMWRHHPRSWFRCVRRQAERRSTATASTRT